MIEDDLVIEELRSIVSKLYLANIEKEYGESGIETTEDLTDSLTKIYSYLDLRKLNKIVVVKKLSYSDSNDYQTVFSTFEEFTNVTENELFVEIIAPNQFGIKFEIPENLEEFAKDYIVYQKEKGAVECFYIGKTIDRLSPLSGLETYFVKPTFKELDSAITKYKVELAQNSSCLILREKLWSDENRIIMVSGPEHIMRDSLYQFLKSRLRGNKEVLREQNVSETEPIDIRVTWNYTNHVALIEIKWIGLTASGSGYQGQSAVTRANKGAKQLANYLDRFKTESSTKAARGYLVVFDGRRNNINSSTTSITYDEGTYFETEEIDYDPDFALERSDFEKPFRLFLTPICTP